MEEKLQTLKNTAVDELSRVSDMETLHELRVKYLGKKGSLTAVFAKHGIA